MLGLTLHVFLYLMAFLAFAIAAVGGSIPRVNLTALGLALLTLTLLI